MYIVRTLLPAIWIELVWFTEVPFIFGHSKLRIDNLGLEEKEVQTYAPSLAASWQYR